jgi:hypothetical protein
MLLFLTTPGHAYTVEHFVRPPPDADVPQCKVTTYDAVLGSNHTVKATHIFTDLERLSDQELCVAATFYRTLRDIGIPCLNNPARVMCRYQLLCNLFEDGINPFAAYRAEARPKPSKFPVFVRNESDHNGPMSALLNNQDELDNYLKRLVEGDRPLRGLLVIEYAAEPLPSGIWRKKGTYRIGKNYSHNHQLLCDTWIAKTYSPNIKNVPLQLQEQAAVIANEVPDNVHRAFDIAGVEWGRADHTTYRGQEIIYEINTAPASWMTDPYGNPIRIETRRIEAVRMYAHMRDIDWGDGLRIRYRPGKPLWQKLAENHRIRDRLRPIWRRLPENGRIRRLFKWSSS